MIFSAFDTVDFGSYGVEFERKHCSNCGKVAKGVVIFNPG